jgi:hypothetical protein
LIAEANLWLYCRDHGGAPITIRYVGEARDHAPSFTKAPHDISSRARTHAEVIDTPSDWVEGQYNASPDLSPIIQEIVDQPGWEEGNALVIFIHDENADEKRVVTSFEFDPTRSVKLTMTYRHP